MAKYSNLKTGILKDVPHYEKKLADRGIKQARIYRTMDFSKLKGINIPVLDETEWVVGTSLHKLAVRYYGSGEFYWVIGLVNNKPTDAHYNIGDIVVIPGEAAFIDSLLGEPDVQF
jgi:hypothetical protein